MARTDNLTNFITDIANAIRTKGGTTAPIPAAQLDNAILNLTNGGGDSEVLPDNTVIISTQAEFEALIAPDGPNSWNVSTNNISSVAFDGETL